MATKFNITIARLNERIDLLQAALEGQKTKGKEGVSHENHGNHESDVDALQSNLEGFAEKGH